METLLKVNVRGDDAQGEQDPPVGKATCSGRDHLPLPRVAVPVLIDRPRVRHVSPSRHRRRPPPPDHRAPTVAAMQRSQSDSGARLEQRHARSRLLALHLNNRCG